MYKKRNDEKFMPSGWHWKITPEQIEKIKANDRDTINQVYFDNLKQFKKMAYKYCGENKLYSFFRDCVQQVYLDLPLYRFDSCFELSFSIKNSFARACMSCKRVLLSLDKLLTDGDRTYADILIAINTPEKCFDDKEEEKHALQIISNQSHLTERARDILTAYALNCNVYKGLFAYEFDRLCKA